MRNPQSLTQIYETVRREIDPRETARSRLETEIESWRNPIDDFRVGSFDEGDQMTISFLVPDEGRLLELRVILRDNPAKHEPAEPRGLDEISIDKFLVAQFGWKRLGRIAMDVPGSGGAKMVLEWSKQFGQFVAIVGIK